METIRGTATKVRDNVEVRGNNNTTTIYVAVLEINTSPVIIKSVEPIEITENDNIIVAGHVTGSGFHGLAYKNVSTNIVGDNGCGRTFFHGLIITLLCGIIALQFIPNVMTFTIKPQSLLFIIVPCILMITGLYKIFIGVRLLQAKNLVNSSNY